MADEDVSWQDSTSGILFKVLNRDCVAVFNVAENYGQIHLFAMNCGQI